MADNFTKLFGSITASTVWMEDSDTRIVWVTMLAMADSSGYVGASIPGLASIARVPIDKVRVAIDKFLAPDPDSRSKEHEGRRIEEVDRGWVLLNYGRFRALRAEEERRERDRVRQERKRERDKSRSVTVCHASSQEVREVTESHETPSASSDPVLEASGSGRAIPAPPSTARPAVWPASRWLAKFGEMWCAKYQQIAYGRGNSDAKATGELGLMLADLDAVSRADAEARAGPMIAEFLANESPKVVEARHPWSFFVTAWNGLRVPKAQPKSTVQYPRLA